MMMMELYDISLNMCFLRCLSVFEKWSGFGKSGPRGVKNGVKWGKKLGLESPFIHY